MNKLVITRHGPYGPDYCLNDRGRKQMRLLAEQLRPQIDGDKIVILSSTADRARQSAEILGEVLGATHQLHEVLWSEGSRLPNHGKVLELIRAHEGNAETLILVTHLEYGEEFPAHFGHHALGGIRLDGFGIEKGQAWVIDTETKRMALVAPAI